MAAKHRSPKGKWALPAPLGAGALHFWLVVGMVVAGSLLHYAGLLAGVDPNHSLTIAHYAMDRVVMIVPVLYAGFIFGPRIGFAALIVVTLVMLPRATVLVANPLDELLELGSVVLVSIVIVLWFGEQLREKDRRTTLLDRLEMARRELAIQVEIIRRDEQRLAAINEICAVISGSLDLPRILSHVLDKVVYEMNVSAALLFLKDSTHAGYELVAYRGVSEGCAKSIATLSELAVEGAPPHGPSFAERGQEGAERGQDGARPVPLNALLSEGFAYQLAVPLCSKGNVVGAICVASQSQRRFNQDEVELLSAIGSQVGVAIDNARLYQHARSSEEQYRDLFENATVAIFVHDMAGSIIAANHACAVLTGRPVGELERLNVAALFPSQAATALRERERAILEGAASEPFDLPLAKANGSEAVVSLSARLVMESGRPHAFQLIAVDVTEQRRMRNTLNHYVRQVLTAQEEERKRIARELHDDTAQSMLLILRGLDELAEQPRQPIGSPGRDRIDALHKVVLDALVNLRRLTHDLRPQILDDLGLVAAIEWLAEDLERQQAIKVPVTVVGNPRQVPPETQLLVFRIVQEALSNVRRHSGASAVRIALEFELDQLRIAIADDGCGFEMPEGVANLAGGGKLGLLGMWERARLLEGTLAVTSAPGEGTKVALAIPC